MKHQSTKFKFGITGSKGRVVAMLMIVVTAMLGFTSAAVAEPPLNDHQTNATIIEGIPYTNTIDTIEATKVLEDPICISEADSDQTVWYSYTPGETTFINANTIGSKYDTILSAYEVGLEELVPIACHDDIDFYNKQSRIRFEAQAGVTYLFMIASYYSDQGGDMDEGGEMTFNLIPGAPPVQIQLAIDSRGTFSPQTGSATLRGTVTCTGQSTVFINGSLRQRAGRLFIDGSGSTVVFCTDTTPWSLEILSYNGRFAGGQTDANIFAESYGEDYEDYSYTFESATVRLAGSRR